MYRIFFLLPFIVGTASSADNEIAVNQVPMKWQYGVAATKYWEGLPIGTGRFGAMIPGNVDHEVIAFNDETLYTGGPNHPQCPNASEILKKIRECAFARDWEGATKEAWFLCDTIWYSQAYQPMAQLNLQYDGHDTTKASEYKRSLDMDKALAEVSYKLDGVNYFRNVFASYPDQVIVIRLTADKKGKINLSGWFTSLQPTATTRVENNEIIMEGSTVEENAVRIKSRIHHRLLPAQMKWQSKVKIIPEGGTLSADGDRFVLKNADAATLILAGATNWKAWNDISADEKQRCGDYIANASQHSYSGLLKRHLDDYCPLFAACKIDLGADPAPTETTTQRMDAIRKGTTDPAYEARYFQYARYLLLAAARENTLAFNNHNIWLNDLEGRWDGRWTLNININECYWCVENTNLPRINESLVYFVEQLAQSGARTAKELYGCRGWCSHHTTDGWFHNFPAGGNPKYATYPVSGWWLMQQLYDHYLYDPDPDYLKRIYPLLKGSVEFCFDFMLHDPITGYLVTNPSTSPENSFLDDKENKVSVSIASASDIQIARNLLRNFIEATGVLHVDEEMRDRAKVMLQQLPPHQIGKFGQLQEWFYDFKEAEVTHRHLMHLWAFYPDDDITIRKTPELAEAIKVVLQRRGNESRGWSGAWRINLFARFEEPEKAYDILHKMQAEVGTWSRAEDSTITPSFEGNQAIQGVAAGIAEMLLQSHSGEISLLPALPVQWKTGSVKGLRARCGFEIDMSWQDGALKNAVIKAKYARPCQLRTKSPVEVFCNGQEVKTTSLDANLIGFEIEAGNVYEIRK
jgi:alpha-L-fucosidase 2